MRAFLAWWTAPGRLPALAVLALSVIVFIAQPLPLRQLQDRGFDMAQRLWPQPPGPALVPIVVIDEDSLSKLGQWPWPRTLLATLIRRIAAGQPAALGIDILFPEADRFSPAVLARTLPDLPSAVAEQLARLPSNDERLAQAIATVPAVLGDGPSEEPQRPGGAPLSVTVVRQLGGDPRPYIAPYPSLIRSLPEITQVARGEAALTSQPDEDGIIRSVPLFTSVKGQLVPTLGLQALRVAAGIPSLSISTGTFGIESVGLGPLNIPTDAHGRAYLHFGRPRARYMSAATVLEDGFDPGQFRDQIVLLGVTGLGLVDQKLTPMGLTQGIDVHAELIESILGETLLHRSWLVFWIELALVLLAGFAAVGLLRYETPPLAVAIAVSIALVSLALEFALFRFAGWLVDGVYPAFVALLCAGAMVVGHLRAAQLARRQLAAELAHQREIAARTEGELAAARNLQLGLLPHRFPPFPHRPDIDLFARIEPARAVGGDFFDFMLIDEESLFFIIADVSGKGVPAALFMELTLQIVRAAIQNHRCDLGEVLIEANAKTAAASLDMGDDGGMFVTAFAGIVNTRSGDVTFGSAGHDSPYIVSGLGKVRQFETEGGPPLGVLDDYIFPVDQDRLNPGEVLLLFTDGVTEAQDAGGQLYSSQRLSLALQKIAPEHARRVVDGCFAAVNSFVRDAEQADDITVLAIRLAPEHLPAAAMAAA